MSDLARIKLKDQLVYFLKDHSYIDRLAPLRIIDEWPIEWNSSLFTNYSDFMKIFENMDRGTLRHWSKRKNQYHGMRLVRVG